MLLSKQESKTDLYFTRGRHSNIDIYYKAQSYFHLPKIYSVIIQISFILLNQTPRDIIVIFHDIAGLDMNLEEWKQFCRKAWENQFDYLQIDRIAKIGNGRYTIRNCNKNTYIECSPETKPFWKHITLIHTSTPIRVYHNRTSLNDHNHIFSKTITFTTF